MADIQGSVPSEVRAKYIDIIDDILSKADLTEVTEKRIRNGIQERVEYDITPQKAAIKTLILERFDIFEAKSRREQEPVPSVEASEPAPTNGHTASHSPSATSSDVKREASDSDTSDVDDGPPQRKKVKRKESVDDDAAFAARLQAEEDRNSRPTRGGAPRKQKTATKKSKSSKKKTSTKVTGSDDSDVESSPRKVNRNTGFHKPMNLSAQAADFFGQTQISRPQMTKKIWEYIKANDLQDPADKRFIVCDEKLKPLLQQDKISMFKMTKALNQHLYNPEE